MTVYVSERRNHYRNVDTAFSGPPSGGQALWVERLIIDAQDGGSGRIAGTVRVGASPVAKRVCLFDKISKRLIRETFSDPTSGAYSFDLIDKSRLYIVLSFDETGAFNAVVADGVAPV